MISYLSPSSEAFLANVDRVQRAVQDLISIQQHIVSTTQRGEDIGQLKRTRDFRAGALASHLMFQEDASCFASSGFRLF